ncbi:MAG TPA: DUF1223 domain-containing protein [Thermoanaerobaculia bacterium]|nr:DUF1223 domain-containing protein [Thermoanaerobaculia bacterium]
MPRPRILVVLAAAAVLATLALTMHGAPPKLGPTPVVVELFTSQGCSSCPPADALIHDLNRDPALRGHVISLAYHVDYWDRLGWRDPFSNALWSQRQVRYAQTMHLASAYTPQAVVSGTRELIGSNRTALSAALERASNDKPHGEVALTVRRDRDTVVATIHATIPEGADLMLALTQDDITTKIEHGENAGRTLTNDAVVRRLVRVDPGQTLVQFKIDPAWRNLSAAAFVQDRATLAIGAAAAAQVQVQ